MNTEQDKQKYFYAYVVKYLECQKQNGMIKLFTNKNKIWLPMKSCSNATYLIHLNIWSQLVDWVESSGVWNTHYNLPVSVLK